MDFSQWSPIRIIIGICFCLLVGVGLVNIVKGAVEKAVFYFRRKAQIEGITFKGVVRDWVNSEAGVDWRFVLFITLFVFGIGYVLYGGDIFSPEKRPEEAKILFWVWLGLAIVVNWVMLEGKIDDRVNKLDQELSELNRRLSDMETALRQLKRNRT